MIQRRRLWVALATGAAVSCLPSISKAAESTSQCPDIDTLPGIVLGMLVASTIIHASATVIQAELIHSKRVSLRCATSGRWRFLLISSVALLIAAILLLDITLWAWAYQHVGAIPNRNESLYFSGITFTTVGYGDITLSKCWQLLSVGEAVNGVLMAGWSTAQLLFLVQRMINIRMQSRTSKTVDLVCPDE